MKPAPFEYHRPESLEQALALLAEHGDDAKPLAGGQSLVPLLAMRLAQPAHLIDLERIAELRGTATADDEIVIGAMTTESELEARAAELGLPASVREAIARIGHFQIRNRGTVGGSLAHCDPSAEWPALLLLLDGTVTARSRRGDRTIAAGDFIMGPLFTALQPDEVLVDVHLPKRAGGSGLLEVERRSGDFALVGAAYDSGRVAVFGSGPRAQRLGAVERCLAGGGSDPAEVRQLAAEEIEATADIHATAAYRKRVGAELVARVVSACHS